MKKIIKILLAPFKMLYAKIDSVGYAKSLGVNISGRVHIYGSSYGMFSTEPWLVTLGDNVHVTNGVKFICHDGGTLILRKYIPSLEITKPITIGNDVYIGTQTIILPGVSVGNNCIIGAGSLVTKDIPEGSVAAGVPARVIKTVEEYLEKVKNDSLNIGHLSGEEKAREIKKIYGIRK